MGRTYKIEWRNFCRNEKDSPMASPTIKQHQDKRLIPPTETVRKLLILILTFSPAVQAEVVAASAFVSLRYGLWQSGLSRPPASITDSRLPGMAVILKMRIDKLPAA